MLDNNINSEEQSTRLERLRYTHELVNDLIKTFVSKAQAYVSLAGAMTGVLAFLKPEAVSTLSNPELFDIFTFGCVASSAICWFCSGFAIFPRLHAGRTIFSIQRIANQLPKNSKNNIDAGFLLEISEQDFEMDLAQEIVTLANIGMKKYHWLNRAAKAIFMAMFFFFIAVVIRIS